MWKRTSSIPSREPPVPSHRFGAGKHTPEINLAGLRFAVGLPAFAAFEHLQLLHGHTVGLRLGEAAHQLLDFLFLGAEEPGRGLFFFEPAIRCRVSSMTRSAYCLVSCSNWL